MRWESPSKSTVSTGFLLWGNSPSKLFLPGASLTLVSGYQMVGHPISKPWMNNPGPRYIIHREQMINNELKCRILLLHNKANRSPILWHWPMWSLRIILWVFYVHKNIPSDRVLRWSFDVQDSLNLYLMPKITSWVHDTPNNLDQTKESTNT